MKPKIGIGHQDFQQLREKNIFYIDKTNFIEEWWNSDDVVTLIARPRRFGKTLTLSMVDHFFSIQYTKQSSLFQGLLIWENADFRILQGTYPVINLSFANVKENDFLKTKLRIYQILEALYNQYSFLLDTNVLTENDKKYFRSINHTMDEVTATMSIHNFSKFLHQYYGKNVIILLDEYDTPMQEAYINGFWKELTALLQNLFHSAFKTNPYLERAILTGITRISKESIFSDLNNLKVITTTSDEYASCFGFTEKEVFHSLDEFGLSHKKQEVKTWYDGFTFGNHTEMYNPWSIINYLDTGKIGIYWANTSSNRLVGKLIREGSREIKQDFERLLSGKSLFVQMDEQIVYNYLDTDESAVWSLLLASGYLKAVSFTGYHNIYSSNENNDSFFKPKYELAITNLEIKYMFQTMIHGWFQNNASDYNDFLKALLIGDVKAMNTYMNRVALTSFSYFDTGRHPSAAEPERFYHGFVLGLIVELSDRYIVTSNRESGFGRYDIMLEPRNTKDHAILLEFKVQEEEEDNLSDTVAAALKQIEQMKYEAILLEKGIVKENIRKYGFAFCGKNVLIGESRKHVAENTETALQKN